MIDTHAHIYDEGLIKDIDILLTEASQAGVSRIYMPNIDQSSIESLHHLADTYPEQCIPMMGLHPCYVKEDYQEQLAVIRGQYNYRTYAGVGEVGLDYYWDTTFVKEQKEAFSEQISWGQTDQLPIIIHSRDSLDDTIGMIASAQDGSLRGIFHCFNGTIEQAKKALDTGFHLGLGGVITFKNAKLDDMVKYLPEDRIVLETDAPYLTPHPYRGKPNQPKYLNFVAQKISECKGQDFEEVVKYTTDNAIKLFG
jgi:TatD DNase family protein